MRCVLDNRKEEQSTELLAKVEITKLSYYKYQGSLQSQQKTEPKEKE